MVPDSTGEIYYIDLASATMMMMSKRRSSYEARKRIEVVVLTLYKAVHYEPASKTHNDIGNVERGNDVYGNLPPLGLVR